MVEVKVERRSSGRLVSKRIILSEDDDEGGTNDENAVPSSGNFRRNGKRRSLNFNATTDEDEDEEFVPKLKASQIVSDEEEESGDVSLDRRSRRERVQELRDRQSNRKRRMRESEKLMSDFVELEDRSERKLRNEKAKMEEDDAALAAAISAGYFSDDEKDLEHVRLRNGTRFKDNTGYASSTATTPTFNPYARNGLGAYSGPMRRSERNAAVVSAARVAMYTSMLNPDSSVYHSGTDENSQLNGGNKYNLRPNRHGDSSAGAAALPSGYYEYNSADRSGAADTSDRLFEEDDVDGNLNVNRNDSDGGSGEVSLAALDKIAGMDGYVRKLKEMIVFPLVYPQLFSKLNVSLPRGVLFHGPPGTGKTLMARLLASACSTSTRKVSFFMRNGSDCLSKWIGEAERNMRLLFKKAKDCQPSIIFFDEIDGLAPERTGRQDQSHISLVSTLLALMDGLDDRGQVVVIGATNRIHSIDAALRRPGRFDREFFFSLPDEAARSQILKIHTKTWEPAISDSLADDLACRTAGFSGADMKALCVEAALKAVQRTFPEVYKSNTAITEGESKLFEGVGVEVTSGDFEFALLHMTPSTRRHVSQYDLVSLQKPQSLLYDLQASHLRSSVIDSVLRRNLTSDASGKVTWQLLEPLILRLSYAASVHPESMVWRFACGIADGLDGFQVYPVDLTSLSDDASGRSLESSIWRGLSDARAKGGAFCVLFKSYEGLELDQRRSFNRILKRFVTSLLPGEPVVLIYTACKRSNSSVKSSVKSAGKCEFELCAPSCLQITEYFNFLLRSIYRLLESSEPESMDQSGRPSKRLLLLSEADFLSNFQISSDLDSVMRIERARMDICDLVSRDPDAFATKYFQVPIFDVMKDNVFELDHDNKNIGHDAKSDKSDNEQEDKSDNGQDDNVNESDNEQDDNSDDGLPEDFLFK